MCFSLLLKFGTKGPRLRDVDLKAGRVPHARGYVTKEVQAEWLNMSIEELQENDEYVAKRMNDFPDLDTLPEVRGNCMYAQKWHEEAQPGRLSGRPRASNRIL